MGIVRHANSREGQFFFFGIYEPIIYPKELACSFKIH